MSGLLPVCIHKVSLENSHSHWFMFCLVLPLHYDSKIELLELRVYDPQA